MARAVLATIAALSPSAEGARPAGSIPLDWFRWLPYDDARVLTDRLRRSAVGGNRHYWRSSEESVWQPPLRLLAPDIHIDRDLAERLAAVDQVRIHHALALGWLFVAGPAPAEGDRPRRVFQPIVTAPVKVDRSAIARSWLHLTGDVEIELVADPERREALGDRIVDALPASPEPQHASRPSAVPLDPRVIAGSRMEAFALDAARAAGFDAVRVVPATENPEHYLRGDELVVVAGLAVYATKDAVESSRAASLRRWADGPLDRWTAFHAIYLGDPLPEPPPPASPVESPYVLTPAQRTAVASSRSAPITVISGAPGTGKSHTICAVAMDALAHGQSVLVGAKTDAAVDALIRLFDEAPGPEPIVFGSNERRDALADRLSSGLLAGHEPRLIAVALDRLDDARDQVSRLRSVIVDRLDAERVLAEARATAFAAHARAPGLFSPTVDLDHVVELIDEASDDDGWLARHHAHRAVEELAPLTGGPRRLDPNELREMVAVARAQRTVDAYAAASSAQVDAEWRALVDAEKELRRRVAKWLDADCHSADRLGHAGLSAVAALATALRSGRSARRAQLARLDDRRLTRALPLWVGSLPDIDDLLPCTPALFDLVILDEASFIDQPLAVPALLRADRAVVVGDPHQLRHVSFLSDAAIGEEIAASGITNPSLVAKLDARRNGAFDIAAGSAPVITLTEHFRSDPHLIDFVAHRVYDDKILVATRNPESETVDCIDVVRVEGRRDEDDVVHAEVRRIVDELRVLSHQSHHSVGVITPFRAQADALEEAVLAAFDADALQAMDLRVGTVHAFQGNERDVVLASLGIDADCGPSTWRFAEDAHLYTVMVTRARRRFVVVCSSDAPPGGLLADYLAQADRPPGRPQPAADVDGWAAELGAGIAAAGTPALAGYPTGRHVVDVCVGDAMSYYGLSCGVHGDGPDAHIERELALRRAGWPMREAFASQWEDRTAELVIRLAER
jgi:hypothetical protein